METMMWPMVPLKNLMDRVEQSSSAQQGSLTKTKVEVERSPDPQAAYLGPRLWEKPISLQQFNEDDFFVMNIDEFLTENNLSMESKEGLNSSLKYDKDSSPEPETLECSSPSAVQGFQRSASPASRIVAPSPRPGVIVSSKKNLLPKGDNTFLYVESKRARLEREKAERKRKLEVDIDFAPEDLALATVPGAEFDPRQRAFDMEELRPQPIIRKRPKLFVPDESKDGRYWEKRGKNNVAARRSREARRLKENQIAIRAAFLERENSMLKKELEDANFRNTKLAVERDILKQKLGKYE